jgi:3-deoxy-7-phosphoheptulonate synthase
MIVVMKSDASISDISSVVKTLESMGYKPHPTRGAERTIIGVVDARQGADFSLIETAEGVDQVIPITKAYKMVSREFRPENTIVNVNGVAVGGDKFVVMAGPCAVENRDQVLTTARAVRAGGAAILRGGAFKPRTSP